MYSVFKSEAARQNHLKSYWNCFETRNTPMIRVETSRRNSYMKSFQIR